MTKSINAISIYYNGFNENRLVGKLLLKAGKPIFSYDAQWLADGLPLSPINMPCHANNTDNIFYGQHANSHYLCGLLADSLPDGWGMLLMDRFFQKYFNKPRHEITVLDRFTYLGSNNERLMGALSFQPEQSANHENVDLDLILLAVENEKVLLGQDTDILQQLLMIGGSPQGARPKSLVYYDPKNHIISTNNSDKSPFVQPWLIKFPAQNEDKSICLLEFLYADYAKQAGLIMPNHQYFDISEKHSAFGVQRDRSKFCVIG